MNSIKDFVDSIFQIKEHEFFSCSELIKVKEVSETVETYLNMEIPMNELAYYNLPVSGFRFVYFSVMGDFNPAVPELNISKMKVAFENKDAIFEYDNCFVFIGIPEPHFKKPYQPKFETIFEDVQCSRF